MIDFLLQILNKMVNSVINFLEISAIILVIIVVGVLVIGIPFGLIAKKRSQKEPAARLHPTLFLPSGNTKKAEGTLSTSF